MVNTIKTALQYYLTSGNCNDTNELVNVCRAIDELDELRARGVAENEHIFFVPNCSAIGLLNLATYDDYGRLARQNPDVTFEQYADSAREFDLVCLTDDTLKSGYYFLRDLWSDNERYGYNNPDGTIKR